jgi:hypothetical protein
VKALAVLLLAGLPSFGAERAAALSQEIRHVELDPGECYRVRDLQIAKDEGRIFLNEGLLIFLKPVGGRRLGAVFTAEVEGGDAEILLLPPTRGERSSLATFIKAPNLNEHFRNAIFLFTDDSAAALQKAIGENEFNKKASEEGFLIASRWNAAIRNISGSFELRLIDDVLTSRTKEGFFFAAIAGNQLGNFDFIFDPRVRQQITIGRFTSRENRSYYDVWTHFTSKSFRGKLLPLELKVSSFDINARIEPNLHLTATTRIRAIPRDAVSTIALDISPRMKISAVEVNGIPAEVFRPESLRSNLLRGDQNETFLIVMPQALEPGRECEITVRHDGDVIHDAGNKVYFVAARINWYPQRGTQFAGFDLTFRYPKALSLITSGELVDERVEGEERISHRRSPVPLRFAGFNLGDYIRTGLERGGYKVDVYANRQLESALEQRPIAVTMPPPPGSFPRRRLPDGPSIIATPTVRPQVNLQTMSAAIAEELEWMAQRLGPPPLRTLAVSPIPGQFGQGFPGLLYLSTLSYLQQQPVSLGASREEFFGDMLHAHETAHQWWGNAVASAGYEDDWLQEALANYMALGILEKRKSVRAMDAVLAEYRDRLLRKDSEGNIPDAAGPVILGIRLQSSNAPGAWRTVIYDKGSWIIHMLRRRLGEDLFWALLSETAKRYQRQSLTTTQFRDLAVEFVSKQAPRGTYREVDPKLDSFFDTWTQGTGIPALKLNWTVKGVAPKVTLAGTVTQTDAPEDFSDAVPVEIQLGRGKSLTKWVRSSSEPVSFTVVLPSAPVKVLLDPQNATLKR